MGEVQFEVSTVLVLAIVWYKDSFINIWKFCARVWFAFTAILENIRSRVPTTEPFSEQSLKAQQKPSEPRPVPVARLPLLPKAYIFKHLKLYPEYYSLLYVSSAFTLLSKGKHASWVQASLVHDQQLVGVTMYQSLYPQHSSVHAHYLWCIHDVRNVEKLGTRLVSIV